MKSTLRDLLAEGKRRLAAAPFAPATREAHLLLARILRIDEARVLAHDGEVATPAVTKRFQELLDRRLSGEPMAYVLGNREFYGRVFQVDRRVLIPRPETEHLVEAALRLELPPKPRILDIGTGSGCLAITLALEIPQARVVAVDRSLGALDMAAENSRNLGTASQVRLVSTDLSRGLDLSLFDLVVSNPPYVDPKDYPLLSPEVRDFEPRAALESPGCGTAVLARLLRELTPPRGSWLLLEIGFDQEKGVRELVASSLFRIHDIVRTTLGTTGSWCYLAAEGGNVDRFRVEGPCRLVGNVEVAGAKNAALPALAASLLTDQSLELERVPRVQDIRTLLRVLEHLGVTNSESDGLLRLQFVTGSRTDDAPYELVKRMRASVLVLGPLTARLGHARVSLPGGCAIGVRPVDQHLSALEALGARVSLEHGYVTAQASRLRGARFRFAVPTVTGTENILMAATLARGTTVLENCAQEPEVADLAVLLTAMGAKIEGAGSERIEIEGVDRLEGAKHAIIPDRIEAGTYLIAGALTRGDLRIVGPRPADLAPLLEKLAETGCALDQDETSIHLRREGDLLPRDVVTAPHPGFPTDLQAQYMVLMTQASGGSTVCETVFENRFQHVPELMRMGADIQVEGSYARIHGPSALSGASVMATDLRASACLVLAGLAASGTTIVDRIYHLDRGYEVMESKLQNLGATVERLQE